MLKFAECQEAIALAAERQGLARDVASVQGAGEVVFRALGGSRTALFAVEHAQAYGAAQAVSASVFDGLRTLVIGQLRERIADVDRRLSQLVEKD